MTEVAVGYTRQWGFACEEITLNTNMVLETVGENFEPEDVFNAEELAKWATDNGYVKDSK